MNGRSVLYINPLLLNAFLFIFLIISSYCNVRQYHFQNCPFAQTPRYDEKDNLLNIWYTHPKGIFVKTLVVIFLIMPRNQRYLILNQHSGFAKGSLMFLN